MSRPASVISVVIPVRNSRKTVGKCMDSLARLSHPSYEVIVVDDGSTDGTPEICGAYAWVRLIRLDKGGPSRARNAGVEAARGDLIAFTDGDCIVDTQWLNELEKGFTGPEVAGVGGDQTSPDDETARGKTIQAFFKTIGFMTDYIKTERTLGETNHNPSCNVAYRKSVLREVGGFDETLWPGEDLDLDERIRRRGYKLVYNPAAVVGHYRPQTYREFARMMWRYGACQWELINRYGVFRKIYRALFGLLIALVVLLTLIVWDYRTWPLVLVPLSLLLLWFWLKTRHLLNSIRFSFLTLLTLATWTAGFLTGHWYQPGD
jgi:cellulose synthase/poly-beta-1,6-N-acetylglucosamine synthase-like glycosyltransferase